MREVLICFQNHVVYSLGIQVKVSNQGFHFLDLHSAKSYEGPPAPSRLYEAHNISGDLHCPEVHSTRRYFAQALRSLQYLLDTEEFSDGRFPTTYRSCLSGMQGVVHHSD